MKAHFQNEIEEIETILRSVTYMLGKPINENSYEIIDQHMPHVPQSLPKGKMAVCIFKYKDEYLKIGKVGPNSNARFISQHYFPNSSQSNLAKSIMQDVKFNKYNIDTNNVGSWIKEHCQRIDILIDQNQGHFTLELIKPILNYRFNPRYERK